MEEVLTKFHWTLPQLPLRSGWDAYTGKSLAIVWLDWYGQLNHQGGMQVTVGISGELHSSLPRPWDEDVEFRLCLWVSFSYSPHQISKLGMIILSGPGKDWIVGGCPPTRPTCEYGIAIIRKRYHNHGHTCAFGQRTSLLQKYMQGIQCSGTQ